MAFGTRNPSDSTTCKTCGGLGSTNGETQCVICNGLGYIRPVVSTVPPIPQRAAERVVMLTDKLYVAILGVVQENRFHGSLTNAEIVGVLERVKKVIDW